MTDGSEGTGNSRWLRKGAARRYAGALLEAWRARRATRPPSPPRETEARLTRSRLIAGIQARLAVRAGVRLEDFLRHRLASYAARLPVPLEALPVRIDIEAGEAVVTARTGRGVTSTPTSSAADGWLRALEEREGPAAVRELRTLEAALAAVEPRAEAARARIDALSSALADDLASGAVPALPAVEATPEQLGRPPLPPAAPVHLLRGLALALLLAVTWRLAGSVLGPSASSTAALLAAAQREPLDVGLGILFALGATAAIFTFLNVTVARLYALAEAGAGRRALHAGVAGGAALLATAVAASGTAPERIGELVLLATIPLAVVLLVRHAGRLDTARDVAEAAALAWDRERARETIERGRRNEALAQAEAALARIEAERTTLARRIRALEQRALWARRAAEEGSRRETRRLERLSEALAGALELDRYAYLRLASQQAHAALSRPTRTDRPTRLEPAVAPERYVAG